MNVTHNHDKKRLCSNPEMCVYPNFLKIDLYIYFF